MSRLLKRLVVGLCLSVILGFSAAQSFHQHVSLQAGTLCNLCDAAQHSPVLLDAPAAASPLSRLSQAIPEAPVPAYRFFISNAHGLSPPAL